MPSTRCVSSWRPEANPTHPSRAARSAASRPQRLTPRSRSSTPEPVETESGSSPMADACSGSRHSARTSPPPATTPTLQSTGSNGRRGSAGATSEAGQHPFPDGREKFAIRHHKALLECQIMDIHQWFADLRPSRPVAEFRTSKSVPAAEWQRNLAAAAIAGRGSPPVGSFSRPVTRPNAYVYHTYAMLSIAGLRCSRSSAPPASNSRPSSSS